MALLSFPDKCVITRETGGHDEHDEPLATEVVYEGECDYQAGVKMSLTIAAKNAVVYLPKAVAVADGDVVEIETKFGRRLRGIASSPLELEMELSGDCLTEIEIKQGT